MWNDPYERGGDSERTEGQADRPQADETGKTEEVPPLDDATVPPLTMPDDTEGG